MSSARSISSVGSGSLGGMWQGASPSGDFFGHEVMASSATTRGREFLVKQAALKESVKLSSSDSGIINTEEERRELYGGLRQTVGFSNIWDGDGEYADISASLKDELPIFEGIGLIHDKRYWKYIAGEPLRYKARVEGVMIRIDEEGKRDELGEVLRVMTLAILKFSFHTPQVKSIVGIFEWLNEKGVLVEELRGVCTDCLRSIKEHFEKNHVEDVRSVMNSVKLLLEELDDDADLYAQGADDIFGGDWDE